MHTKAHQPLCVVLEPSRMGAAIAVVLHGLAIVAALDAPGPWLAGGLLGLVLLSAWHSARHWRGGGAKGVRAIGRDGAGSWWLETGVGERLEVTLGGTPLVSRILIALSLSAGVRRWHLALLPDAAEPDSLRRLRAALRAGA